AAQRVRLLGEPRALGTGCRFAGVCPRRIGPICDDVTPPVRQVSAGHSLACHLPLAG
ncbi:MAG: hypothetical protein HY060_08690, partial [Proteobacteria bacterium]|nr:hypothetical protein [Pseudomonadota bacterium]